MIPSKGEVYNLKGYGLCRILGVYINNKFPVHVILEDFSVCETFTVEEFNLLLQN